MWSDTGGPTMNRDGAGYGVHIYTEGLTIHDLWVRGGVMVCDDRKVCGDRFAWSVLMILGEARSLALAGSVQSRRKMLKNK